MNRLLALLAVLATITSGVTARAIPAQREVLTQTNRNCEGSVVDSVHTETFGFVNLVVTGSNRIVAVAVLKGGTPNANYNVRLIQIKDRMAVDCGVCTKGGATLTTDDRGDGSINVQQAVAPGATAAWVDLNNKDDCANFFNIAPLSIV
ncbi:hypothetical protein ASPVEDRAFT_41461 [Aspergillus versicolor CBS 583.65]|uniref:Pectate lyase n=1 Tax=Aspergillus versicolor CBS 583.65 TaxID=1036611 RepID=A0A1L9PK92_ASPVE|nr:uncharacterized protein ASPVEDRAFT_41461 [Aspergillus versicolor CBS 583.65]OJJ01911.1 hypothetical protein ASPVEDRAFT_41461 [Aspergillus versicolor CBS 583.65]